MYTRYHSGHGFGFLGTIAPNGLIIDCWGPGSGRHNDNWLVAMSGLRVRLRSLFDLCPNVALRNQLRCYGDLIFGENAEISRGWRSATRAQQAEQGKMNRPRTEVEHVFGKTAVAMK